MQRHKGGGGSRRLPCLLLMFLLALTVSGCTQNPESGGENPSQSKVEIPEAYTDVMDTYYYLLTGTGEAIDERIGPEGINGVVMLMSTLREEGITEEAPTCVGYTVQDISGDGVPELIIADIAEKEDGTCRGSMVYAVYTTADGKAYNVLEGWNRNRYDWTGDGRFFNRGSAGAAYAIIGDFALSKDGRELVFGDYWFTYDKNNGGEEIAYFHNTTGQWDVEASEEISAEAFYQAEEELKGKIEMLELTAFADYTPAKPAPDNSPAKLSAAWAEDELSDYAEYDTYVAEDASGAETVVFCTDKEITNFKVLELSLENADEEGNITFAAKTLYKQKELTPEGPLLVTMPIYGSIPNWGIAYTDRDGKQHTMSVSVSGKDGSLLLEDISVSNT